MGAEGIMFTARAEYTNGSVSACVSFKSTQAPVAWATAELGKDPGAVVTAWKAFTAEVFCIYRAG